MLMLGSLTTAPAIHRALTGPENPAPLTLSERAVRGHMRAVERRWAQRARSAELDVERGRVIASLEEQARTAARRSALNANDNVGVGYARVQLQATEQLIGLRGLDAPIRTEIAGPGGGPVTLLALADHPAEHLDPREEARRLRQLAADAEARANEADESTRTKGRSHDQPVPSDPARGSGPRRCGLRGVRERPRVSGPLARGEPLCGRHERGIILAPRGHAKTTLFLHRAARLIGVSEGRRRLGILTAVDDDSEARSTGNPWLLSRTLSSPRSSPGPLAASRAGPGPIRPGRVRGVDLGKDHTTLAMSLGSVRAGAAPR